MTFLQQVRIADATVSTEGNENLQLCGQRLRIERAQTGLTSFNLCIHLQKSDEFLKAQMNKDQEQRSSKRRHNWTAMENTFSLANSGSTGPLCKRSPNNVYKQTS